MTINRHALAEIKACVAEIKAARHKAGWVALAAARRMKAAAQHVHDMAWRPPSK